MRSGGGHLTGPDFRMNVKMAYRVPDDKMADM